MTESGERLRPAPLKIGGVAVVPPVVLAPMAGVTDDAYRSIVARFGAGLVTTEMISVEGLRRDQPSTWKLCMQNEPLSVPLAVQLFGRDPSAMAEAAKRVEARGASVIDINAGCPVKKVARQGAGASLLRDPDRLARMVEEIKKSVTVPVTVKIRLGWDRHSIIAVDLAQKLASAGADALAVHGRTASEHYSGTADWDWIKKVKAAVGIPVIGNGDVQSPEHADRILRETGCDAVMIGRASLGNPWIFSAVAASWGYGRGIEVAPNWGEFYDTVRTHLENSIVRKGKPAGHARKLLIWYSKGFHGASSLRSDLAACDRTDGMLRVFHAWVEQMMARGLPFLPVKMPGIEPVQRAWTA